MGDSDCNLFVIDIFTANYDCPGSACFGNQTEEFSLKEHLEEEEIDFVNRRVYYTKPFNYYYILNFRPWERMRIERVQYYQPVRKAEVESFSQFIYRVERADKSAYHDIFEVQRGNKNWYLDFYWAGESWVGN